MDRAWCAMTAQAILLSAANEVAMGSWTEHCVR